MFAPIARGYGAAPLSDNESKNAVVKLDQEIAAATKQLENMRMASAQAHQAADRKNQEVESVVMANRAQFGAMMLPRFNGFAAPQAYGRSNRAQFGAMMPRFNGFAAPQAYGRSNRAQFGAMLPRFNGFAAPLAYRFSEARFNRFGAK